MSVCLPVAVGAVSGGDDVLGADERPAAAGQRRLPRVHNRRHPGELARAGVPTLDDPPLAATAGLTAH